MLCAHLTFMNLIVQAMLKIETFFLLNVIVRFSTIFPSVQQAVRKREQSLQVGNDIISAKTVCSCSAAGPVLIVIANLCSTTAKRDLSETLPT